MFDKIFNRNKKSLVNDVKDSSSQAIQQSKVNEESNEQYGIDPVKDIKSLIDIATTARDNMIDDMLGPKMADGSGGMQGLIRQGYRFYTPRNWENPPFSKISGGTIDHLVFPQYFSNVQNQLPVVIPGTTKVTVLPLSGTNKEFAAQSTAILSEEIEQDQLQEKLPQIVIGATNNGSQIVYKWTCPKSEIETSRYLELCDPLSVLWDPGATCIEDAEYIIYLRWRLISDVMQEYDLDFVPKPQEMEDKHSSLITLNESVSPETFGRNRCIEIIAFIRDPKQKSYRIMQDEEYVELDDDGIAIIDEEGNPKVLTREVPFSPNGSKKPLRITLPVYPNGRIVKFINDILVYDEPNEHEHGKCPFIKLNRHSIPGQFWGLPEWYTYGGVPHLVNEAMSFVAKNMRNKVTKTMMKRSAFETPVDKKSITNDPADIVIVKDSFNGPIDHAVGQFTIGGSGESAHNALSAVLNISQDITGFTDSFKGKSNANVTSGKQQQLLSDDSERRLFTFSKALELFIEKYGYIALHDAVQYRNPGDVIEIAGVVSGYKGFSIQEFKDNFWNKVQFKTKLIANSGLPTDRQERLKLLTEHLDIALKYWQINPEAARAFIEMSDVPELEHAFEKMVKQGNQSMQLSQFSNTGNLEQAAQLPNQNQQI